LRRGNRVNAQTIALIPPITSSLFGAGPVVLKIVVRTYNGLLTRYRYNRVSSPRIWSRGQSSQ
jgi:hypothetical protein